MTLNLITSGAIFVASRVLAINPTRWCGRIYTLMSCAFLLALFYGVMLFFNNIGGQLSILVKFSLWLQLLGQTTIVLSDFVTVLVTPENFRPPTEQLKNIEISVKRFGFEVNDKSLRTRLELLQIVLAIGVPFGFGFLDLIDIMKGANFPYLPIYFFHYVYALTIINVTEFMFVNNLFMIKRRFAELNRLVNEVRQSAIGNDNDTLDKFDDDRILDQLHLVKKAHYDLVGVSHQVNKSYGLHLLLSITFTVVLITEQLYQNYEAITLQGRSIVESLYTNYTWTGYHITRLCLMIFACYFTSEEANRTASLTHTIPINKASQKLKDEIFHFSLQMQEQLSFTAAGFFDINLSVFTSVIGSVVTYLLIMIQMGNPTASTS